MDHHSIINGIDMSNVLFILLSNTGGREITQKSFEFWQNGRIRNELRYADYERLTLKGAYNEVGGLQKSIIIDKSLIDVYVPFLPLEQKHVRQCVERELISRGYEPDQVGHDFYDQARTSLDMDGTLTIITCCIISTKGGPQEHTLFLGLPEVCL